MAKAALRLLSQRDAAKFLGIGVRTLRYWDKDPAQAPPRRKIGKRYYYQKGELERWLENSPPAPQTVTRAYREPTGTMLMAGQLLAK